MNVIGLDYTLSLVVLVFLFSFKYNKKEISEQRRINNLYVEFVKNY